MKSSPVLKLAFSALAILIVPAILAAQDIPLHNWTVPPYNQASLSGGITTMTDNTPAIAFVGVNPCRLVDTRPGSGFPAGYGGPTLTQGVPRNFDLNNQPNCTDIPAGVEAYSLNITVTNTQGPGFILIYPQGGTQPSVSTVNYVGGQTIANAAIVPAGTGGGVTVIAGVSGTDLIIDINGYFSDELNNQQLFSVSGNAAAFTIFGILLPARLASFNNSSATWSYAVQATSASTANGGAGVYGTANGGDPEGTCTACLAAGVRGASFNGPGVLGLSETPNLQSGGVAGVFFNSSEVQASVGILGFSTTVGVRAIGDITKTGTVSFTEPHPTDASKKITYIALEGGEAGTYFRGRARFQNGIATIDVPEDFRIVTQPEGLSIQVTPIGDMASVAVASIGLDRIVVKGSRNVEFFYTVNGIRRGYDGFRPIGENDKDYLPDSVDARMPTGFSPEIRSRLISNGTFRPDGTVNMETAQRLGWDRIWEERSRRQPPPQQRPVGD